MAEIRASLRDGNGNKDACAVVCLGKNTLIRRTLGLHPDERVRGLSGSAATEITYLQLHRRHSPER